MRVINNGADATENFKKMVLDIGNGRHAVVDPVNRDIVQLPRGMMLNQNTIDALITKIFGENVDQFDDNVILTTLNNYVQDVNQKVCERTVGEAASLFTNRRINDFHLLTLVVITVLLLLVVTFFTTRIRYSLSIHY